MTKSKKSQASPQEQVRPAERICNLVPSRATENDWAFHSAVAAGAVAAPEAVLPPAVDLRAPWWNVGDQERTGSCVGWASTDGVARYHFVQAGRLGKDELLSPRFTWMASKETDENVKRPETMIEGAGTSLKAAADILRNYGAAPETSLQFHIQTNLYLGDPDTFFAVAAGRRIASYFNLNKDLQKWREWLATHGPLLVGLSVDATWDNVDASGKLDQFQPNTVRGGHAVTVVGYRDDGRFILRNSWGTSWGDKGFGYASAAYIQDAFHDESYGFTL